MTALTDTQAHVLGRLVEAGDDGIPVAFSNSTTTVSVIHASALEEIGLAHLATPNGGRSAWVTQAGIDHHNAPQEDTMPDPDARLELTDTQAAALRMLVGDARCRDGVSIGKGTDRNSKTINGRVARALIDAGVAEWMGGQPDGFVVASVDGRAWVQGEGVPDTSAAPLTRAADEHPALTQTAPGTYELDLDRLPDYSQDSGDEEAPDDEEGAAADSVPSTPDPDAPAASDGPAASPPPPGPASPSGLAPDGEAPPPDLPVERYEGRLVTARESRILAAHRDTVLGAIPRRNLDEQVVALVVMTVDQVLHDHMADGELQRTQKLRPVAVYPLPDAHGERLREIAAAIVGKQDGQQPLPFAEDLPAGDPEELIERLNREELMARDDKGVRVWEDDDTPAVAVDQDRLDAVTSILFEAGAKGHPTRSMDHGALTALARDGLVRIETPEGTLAGENSWAWWVASEDPTMDALEAAEADHPQVVITAPSPDLVTLTCGGEEVAGAWATIADAQDFAEQRAGGELEWVRRADGSAVADLPVAAEVPQVDDVDAEAIPF